ncbi:MAG: nucleoside hydrolase [Clostridia bacterium]|nr:nucleoside hydrolase [Clostridia bacterium]
MMLEQSMLLRNLEVPAQPFDCVLDTDTYNEIDDQFALSFMMKHDRFQVKAIYAAPFFNTRSTSPKDGMERSYDEILRLLNLMDRTDMEKAVFKGSENYLKDEKTPVESAAARHLVELSGTYSSEHPLYVVSIGAHTNIASALLMDPSMSERIVLVLLSGHDIHWPDTNEFNMAQDITASRILFDSGSPLIQLPCMGVVSAFYTTGPELEHWLKGKNPLCDYLVEQTVHEAEKYAKDRVWSRVIWDVTAAAWLINDGDRFMHTVIDHTPIITYDKIYAFDEKRPLYRRATYIRRDALFEELFRTLSR